MASEQTVDTADTPRHRCRLHVAWRCILMLMLVEAVCLTASLGITSSAPRLYAASVQLLLMGPMAGPAGPEGNSATGLNESPETQICMLRSEQMPGQVRLWLKERIFQLEAAVEGAFQKHQIPKPSDVEELRLSKRLLDDRAIWSQYSERVAVSNPEVTNILNIAVILPDHDLVAPLANAIGKAFQDAKTDMAQSRAAMVTEYLKERAARAKKHANDAERALVAFMEQHHLVADSSLGTKTAAPPNVMLAYGQRRRTVDCARAIDAQLQSALMLAGLTGDSAVGNVKLAWEARRPEVPAYPDPARNLEVGGVVGLAVWLLVAIGMVVGDCRRARHAATQGG
jgi:uncharacterized protein involved in exopolysaccharide biosynthesis